MIFRIIYSNCFPLELLFLLSSGSSFFSYRQFFFHMRFQLEQCVIVFNAFSNIEIFFCLLSINIKAYILFSSIVRSVDTIIKVCKWEGYF